MSETLQEAPARASHELPFAIDLELRVEDRDVIAALVNFPDGTEREEYALEALKIGVLALRRASSALDGEFIQRETTRMLDTLRSQLEGHARNAHESFTISLKEYFDPNDGRFSQRVQRLIADDGELAALMRGHVDGDDSRLAKTLVAHFGESSPLMKLLSPEQSQGLLALLEGKVAAQLNLHHELWSKEFTLDNADGALCRLVKELTAKHGDLSKDLQAKIDVVIKEFSLDEENSALKRLVNNVESAQKTITNEFSLDNEQSGLRRLKSELTTILEAHVKTNAEFQEEVKLSLAKLTTRREQELRSTLHGTTFQNAVFAFLDQHAQHRGDLAEDTSGKPGVIKNCKIGDAVLQLSADCAAAGAKIVFESKEEIGYTLRAAKEEIEKARKNRDAQQGIFVFSRRTAPAMEALARHGDDVFVVWDAEDPGADAYLNAALEISRALCLRSHHAAQREMIDFAPIDAALRAVEKCATNLDDVGKYAETIKNSAEKIIRRAEIDRAQLDKQVAVLEEALNQVKHTMSSESAADGATSA